MQDLCVRGLAVAPQAYYGSQIVYQVSATPSAEGLLQPTVDVDHWPLCTGDQDRLWQVRSTVLEVVQLSAEVVRPLSQPEILRQGRPRSHLHLRVTVSHRTSHDVYLIDLGQTWEVYAERVTVDVLAPRGAQRVLEGVPVQPLSGVVGNALLVGQVEQIEESRGSNVALLTQTYWARRSQTLEGVVPAGARELTILPDDPSAPVAFQWWRGSPTLLGGFELGTTLLPAAWQPPSSVAPSASHWQISPEEVDRTITLVWKVQA